MIKHIYTSLLALGSIFTLQAQEGSLRSYTAVELSRITEVCNWFQTAIPNSFQNFEVKKKDCGDFSWAIYENDKPMATVNSKGQLTANNYTFSIEFKNTSSEYIKLLETATNNALLEYTNPVINNNRRDSLSAVVAKLENCSTLSVNITANYSGTIECPYYINSRPTKLDLGIISFGNLYTFPLGKPIRTEDGIISRAINNRDKALIVLCNKLPIVEKQPISSKETFQIDLVHINETQISLAPPKEISNIMIEINGDQLEIMQLIHQINWKKLESLLGK